jgi:hypothetical protein
MSVEYTVRHYFQLTQPFFATFTAVFFVSDVQWFPKADLGKKPRKDRNKKILTGSNLLPICSANHKAATLNKICSFKV